MPFIDIYEISYTSVSHKILFLTSTSAFFPIEANCTGYPFDSFVLFDFISNIVAFYEMNVKRTRRYLPIQEWEDNSRGR